MSKKKDMSELDADLFGGMNNEIPWRKPDDKAYDGSTLPHHSIDPMEGPRYFKPANAVEVDDFGFPKHSPEIEEQLLQSRKRISDLHDLKRKNQLTKEECFPMEKTINILALDVATHTGWCTKTAYGTWDFSLKRDESAGMRLVRFKAKLREICQLEEINLVTFELSQGFHQNAVIVQSELHGVLKLFCEENKIDYRSFAPSEIKKFATGKGNANKEKMIEAAQAKYGYFGNDDNTADAMHIFHLTKKSLGL